MILFFTFNTIVDYFYKWIIQLQTILNHLYGLDFCMTTFALKKESVTELIMEMFKLFVLLHAKKTEFGEKPKKN